MKLPVISLSRPWANWVELGWKPIETRTHDRFKNLAGKRIAIHASKTWDRYAIHEALKCGALTLEQIQQTEALHAAGKQQRGGAIICTAFVKEFRKLTAADSRAAMCDCASVERFGLVLENVMPLPPIPWKGQLGIWHAVLPCGTITRNGERWSLNDAGTHYERLLDIAPELETMAIMEELLTSDDEPFDRGANG